MKMHIIGCGRMLLDSSGLLETEPGAKTEWVDIPVSTFLFDHPDGPVLYDTACDPEGMSKNWPECNKSVSPHEAGPGEYLPERQKQLGLTPDDIRTVVISHLHTDHAGCLKLFKKARVFAAEREHTEALKQYALRQYQPAYIESDIKGWLDAGLNWRLVGAGEREVKLCDGLTILNFGPGHAYGMLGLLAELRDDGNFLIVSDALYTKDNFGPPARLPGLVMDPAGYLETAETIRRYAEVHRAAILFGHDKAQFAGLRTAPQGFYS
jgi:N-acyl homoserine lactone hydrolase